jgi:hypothetical protein
MPCQTVNVEPASNESTASVSINSVTSPSPQTIKVSYTVQNNITSGDGRTLSPTVVTTVNGSFAGEEAVTVSAGLSVSGEFEITQVPGGNAEVCVEIE